MRLATLLRFANPRHIWRGRAGLCPVCGRRTFFLVTCEPDGLRNDAFCARCGSIARTRHIALAMLDALAPRDVRTVAALGRRPDIAVWHTAARGALARVLRPRPRSIAAGARPVLVLSEYFDGVPSGQVRHGVLCQDVQATSFDAATFDLVLTEDVLEHVPDFRAALAEIRRVLKPGGVHVFSVPYYPDEPTRALFERTSDGWRPLGPVEYHDDAVRGRIATYTRFGRDFPRILEDAGFAAIVRRSTAAEERQYATFHCVTFVTRRPVG